MRDVEGDAAPARARRGFTLIVVIWGLGVISLLILSYLTTARERLQTAANVAGATRARLLADGAATAVLPRLLSDRAVAAAPTQRGVHNGEPHYCALGGGVVAVAMEDESGKVDLNAASPQLLAQLFAGLGAQNAEALARAVVEFRTRATNETAAANGGGDRDPTRPFGPKHALFDTALELDQVAGMEPGLFRAAMPLVTVHSRTPGIDPEAAPPALFAALLGLPSAEVLALIRAPYPNSLNRNDPRFPANLKQAGAQSAVLVHAEALLPGGQAAAVDMIVDLTQTADAPFSIKEVRAANLRFRDALAAQAATPLPEC
jgi:general secretion pathway protein K